MTVQPIQDQWRICIYIYHIMPSVLQACHLMHAKPLSETLKVYCCFGEVRIIMRYIFIKENEFENVAKMVVILSWSQCAKQLCSGIMHNGYHISNQMFQMKSQVSKLPVSLDICLNKYKVLNELLFRSVVRDLWYRFFILNQWNDI